MVNRLNHENPPIDPNDTQSKKQYDKGKRKLYYWGKGTDGV